MRSVHPFKWDVLEHQSQTTKNFKLKIFPVSQKKKKKKKKRTQDQKTTEKEVTSPKYSTISSCSIPPKSTLFQRSQSFLQ